MKRNGLLLGTLLVVLNLPAQNSFKAIYGTGREDIPEQIVQRGDGGFTMFGTTNGQIGGTYNFYMVVTDATGTLLWNKEFDFGLDDNLCSAILTADDGYLLTGHIQVTTPWYSDVGAVKIDENGNVEWMKSYGCGFSEGGWDLIEGSDGNFVISGVSSGNKIVGTLMKISPTGDLIWYKRYTPGPFLDAEFYTLTEADNGDYVAAGYLEDTTAQRFGWVVRTDTAGNMLWNKMYYDTGSIVLRSVERNGAGGFYIAGQTYSPLPPNGLERALFMNVSGTGQIISATNYEIPGAHTEIDDFMVDLSGNILCEGRLYWTATHKLKGVLFTITPAGQCLTAQHYSNNRQQDYRGIAPVTGGGAAILSNEDSTHNLSDRWSFLLIRTDAAFAVSCGTYSYSVTDMARVFNDTSLAPSVSPGGTELVHTPATFTGCIPKPSCSGVGVEEWNRNAVVNVYPVPASSVLTVQSNVPGEEATFRVCNSLGELVAEFPVNSAAEIIDIRFLPKGVYYYQLADGNGVMIGSGRFIRGVE